MRSSHRPLDGFTVVDLTRSLGRYPGRLLSDLGAAVTRVCTPHSGPDRRHGRVVGDGDDSPTAEFVFAVAGQTLVDLDPETGHGQQILRTLLDEADILITDQRPADLRRLGIDSDELGCTRPDLIQVAITPYGASGPHADRPATDLTLLAAGGLLNLAGEPERPPVRPGGEQAGVAAGLHGTIGALIALYERMDSGLGQHVDVSAQQAVAHSLENAIQFHDLESVTRGRSAGRATEVANGLFRCLDGWVYLVAGIGGTPLGWDGLVKWLTASGFDGDRFAHGQWLDPVWRRTPSAAQLFRDVFEEFTVKSDKVTLYETGQSFGVSIAPVASMADLLDNPQLLQREFFRTAGIDGVEWPIPGPPYRFEGLDIGPR